MIKSATIKSFKRFSHQNFDIRPLTVLTGLNGAGKTSFLQSFLLMAAASNSRGNSVRLNGPYGLMLGSAEDVLNWRSQSLIEMSVADANGNAFDWCFGIPKPGALYLNKLARPPSLPSCFGGPPRSFTYLSAERVGPRTSFVTSAVPPEDIEIGIRGENCAHLLAALGGVPLHYPERVHPHGSELSASLFKYEVENWMSDIVRPIEIDASELPGPMASVLRYRQLNGEWVRAPNMGFGVSYALPVVAGGLSAIAGGLFIVENPEAHLHPAGQSHMGIFLAWLASKGVQVFVETHSDHVINGVRLAVGKMKYLESDAVSLLFFDESSNGEPIVSHISVSDQGTLSEWPDGFFDQYQLDVAELGRVRRRR